MPTSFESYTPASSPPLTPSPDDDFTDSSNDDIVDVEGDDEVGESGEASEVHGGRRQLPPSSSSTTTRARDPAMPEESALIPLPSAMLSLLFVVENLRNDATPDLPTPHTTTAAGTQMVPPETGHL